MCVCVYDEREYVCDGRNALYPRWKEKGTVIILTYSQRRLLLIPFFSIQFLVSQPYIIH